MIRQINEVYDSYLQEGKNVIEIQISNISYDHLQSELSNIKQKPEWVDKLQVKKEFSGFKIVAEEVVKID